MAVASKKQKIREFGLYSSLILLLAVVWVYFPLSYPLTGILIPAVTALSVRRLDLWYSLAALLLAGVILAFLTGRVQLPLMLLVQSGPLGLLLGLLFKNHVPPGKSLVAAVVFALTVAFGVVFTGWLLTGVNPFILNQNSKVVFDNYQQLLYQIAGRDALDPSTGQEIEKVMEQLRRIWPVLAVSSVLIWSTISAFATYLLTRLAMARLGYSVPAIPAFSRWRLPWYVIWGVIAGLGLTLAGDEAGAGAMSATGKVILWLMGFLLSALGLSVLTFYLKRWRAVLPLKVLVVAVMFIYLPVAAAVLVTLGIADPILNVRRLTPDGRIPEEGDKK